ncbi:uncharacterized protein SPSK_00495 [Sporothrix schenckii 1099-18]|uniref:Uncharacterized protein n=1 Tax=Sporothrix schenckii 1099-18 TaxID=1397361 RepID=A0A0F2LVX5_SPOSC|nr:uncharacterized protein SPSK_00495 [Sporothrix schenckii 1099-18]KJR80046.1 hypothetical protein SPSK_00495 [Sporothrix schenckii 1099-18]
MAHWRSQPAAMMGASEPSRARRISPDMVTDAGDLSGVGAFRSSQSTHRPQVYVHVEFGISWPSRHVPNNHVFTYKSRGLRDRRANFPREAPEPSTHYLSSSAPPVSQPGYFPSFDGFATPQHRGQQKQRERHAVWGSLESQRRRELQQSQNRAREEPTLFPQQHQHSQQRRRNQFQQQLQSQPLPQQQSQLSQTYLSTRYQNRMGLPPVDEETRSSRSSKDSRSSHERGHSAPPPLSGSPWDITTGDASGLPLNAGGSRYAGPTTVGPARAGHPQIWKALPELPTGYRLGEGLPWSQGLPEPGVDPDDERLRPRSQPEAGDSSSIHQSLDYSPFRPFTNRPTVLPIQPTDSGAQRQLDIDTQRKRNLESLSSAMMTIDNGFESQWWNQGERLNTNAHSPTAPTQSVWPSGMSSSALPVSLVLPPSLQGESDDEGQSTSAPMPQQASSLPSSPSSPRRIRMPSLGWAIASSPVSSEPTSGPILPSPSSILPRHPQRVSSLGNHRTSQSSQNVVSPVSQFTGNDLWSPETRNRQLSRSMTTRSDELFFPTGRYA